jgi:ribosomal protein L19E
VDRAGDPDEEAGDDLNWSAITQRALRDAITAQTLKGNPTDMTSVIERLRASKQRWNEASEQRGKACGAKWAREAAEYEELGEVWSSFRPKPSRSAGW